MNKQATKSRTQQAMDWLKANPQGSPYQAAAEFDINPSCLYTAIKRRKGREICKCCGQIVRNA